MTSRSFIENLSTSGNIKLGGKTTDYRSPSGQYVKWQTVASISPVYASKNCLPFYIQADWTNKEIQFSLYLSPMTAKTKAYLDRFTVTRELTINGYKACDLESTYWHLPILVATLKPQADCPKFAKLNHRAFSLKLPSGKSVLNREFVKDCVTRFMNSFEFRTVFRSFFSDANTTVIATSYGVASDEEWEQMGESFLNSDGSIRLARKPRILTDRIAHYERDTDGRPYLKSVETVNAEVISVPHTEVTQILDSSHHPESVRVSSVSNGKMQSHKMSQAKKARKNRNRVKQTVIR